MHEALILDCYYSMFFCPSEFLLLGNHHHGTHVIIDIDTTRELAVYNLSKALLSLNGADLMNSFESWFLASHFSD